MAINSFWQNPFGQNVVDAGLSSPGIMSEPAASGPGLMGRFGFGAKADPVARDALMAFAGQLLAGGGYSPVKQSGSEIFGRALLASQQARAQAQEKIQKQKLQEAQIRNLDEANRSPPASIQEFQYAVQNGFKGTYEEWARLKMGSGAEPPASIQEMQTINTQRQAAGLKPYSLEEWLRTRAQMTPINPSVVNVGNVPTLVQPSRADPGSPVTTPLSTEDAEAAAKAAAAAATASGKGGAERLQTQIDTGLDAADATATVRRGIELLDSVKTGGIDAAKLKATNLFGVTGANEAELSANLGKAVLSQLRATFGAQFTEKEGARLAEIEAGFGKSTEGNRRLLEQAGKILERAARRGIRAAERSGDTETAQEIKDAMQFSLSPDSGTREAPAVGTVKGGYRFKGGDPANKANWVPVK